MVWELVANDGDTIGIFNNQKELALAIRHHGKKLGLSGWLATVEDIMDYEPTELNDLMSKGSVIDYTLNIDYMTYRLPSWDEKLYKKRIDDYEQRCRSI